MKLLFALLPLPTPVHEDIQIYDIASVPRSERCPAYARQQDLPADPWTVALQDRIIYQALFF